MLKKGGNLKEWSRLKQEDQFNGHEESSEAVEGAF